MTLCFAGFLSCEKYNGILDVTDQCEFPESFFPYCFHGISFTDYEELIITDNESYQIFGDSIRIIAPNHPECDTATIPYIDFNRYSLLGKHTWNGCCSATYDRKIYKDKGERKIIYRINVEYHLGCDALCGSWNWVFIPKLSKDYSVEFEVTPKYIPYGGL